MVRKKNPEFTLDRDVIFNTLEEGIIAINTQAEVIYINRSAAEMLNTTEEAAIGLPLSVVYPASRMAQLLETGQAEYNVPMLSLKNVRILSDRMPIREDGKIVGVVAIFRNKTEVSRMAEELTGVHYMVDALRANNHEFINKLHVLLGLIQMEQYEEACNYILKTAMLQKEVIRFVMDSIEVPELAALLIGKISRGSELGIRVQLDPGTHLDKEGNMSYGQALVTIVGNLLENAMEALDHYDEENKQITVGIYGGESDILVTVFDNGPGIPADIQEKIFEEGFSTRGDGRGIGLATLRKITRSYGGDITVDSEEGAGTYFYANIKKEG